MADETENDGDEKRCDTTKFEDISLIDPPETPRLKTENLIICLKKTADEEVTSIRAGDLSTSRKGSGMQ